MTDASRPAAYAQRRHSTSEFLGIRGLRYHVRIWGDRSMITADTPPLVMVHGWMDVGASFQFVVDELGRDRMIIAPDWRGFGLTETPPADSYWFPDYLGDLDALLDAFKFEQIDLVGHSMGGNVVMIYAGVRPTRIRRLVNLEGFGMPQVPASMAPRRYAQWLDELKEPQGLMPYADLDKVAQRLMKNNPRLPADRAAWLAPHWAARRDDGQWHVLGDPAHKRTNPVLYRKDEALECWKAIEAPVMWIEGAQTDVTKWWGNRYPREDFESRLAVVRNLQRHMLDQCGHMLHHDQPQRVAQLLEAFLDGPH